MKNLRYTIAAKSLSVTAIALALAPAIAMANPILEGMQNSTAITIAKGLIMVCALLILGGQTIPDLMKGDGGAVVKSALGVAILIGIAVKLKDIIGLFAI